MKAIVKYDRVDKAVEIRDVPEPVIGPDQVLLEVKAVGVCGSDVHMWREHQSWAIKLPLVLGHEFAGVIAEVGENVTGWQVGDRVACETAARSMRYVQLLRERQLQPLPPPPGLRRAHRRQHDPVRGGAAGHPAPRLDHVPLEYAALTEPVCVAMNALAEKTTIKPGDMTVIQDRGLSASWRCRWPRFRAQDRSSSPVRTWTSTGWRSRRSWARDYVVNIQRQDPLDLVRSLGDGFGADLVVDCTGVSAALQQAMALVRPNGRITKIGWGPQPLNFSLDPLVQKAVTLQGSFSHTFGTWERVIRLMGSGQLNLDPVIGGVYAIDEWETAFAKMEEGENVKSVLKF
ncbi:MAG: alcohol dehydrogenase catalytic domain-containing protein [Caldilineaceae bacterium]